MDILKSEKGCETMDQFTLGLTILSVLGCAALWRWSGTTISPAVDISASAVESPPYALDPGPIGKASPNGSVESIADSIGAKTLGTFKLGGNFYDGAPLLET